MKTLFASDISIINNFIIIIIINIFIIIIITFVIIRIIIMEEHKKLADAYKTMSPNRWLRGEGMLDGSNEQINEKNSLLLYSKNIYITIIVIIIIVVVVIITIIIIIVIIIIINVKDNHYSLHTQKGHYKLLLKATKTFLLYRCEILIKLIQ